jgi:hypothetical protein
MRGSFAGNCVVHSEAGKTNPNDVLNGSPDADANRPFPHELRVEDRVHHRWSAAMIPGSLSLRTDDVVVLDADRVLLIIARRLPSAGWPRGLSGQLSASGARKYVAGQSDTPRKGGGLMSWAALKME